MIYLLFQNIIKISVQELAFFLKLSAFKTKSKLAVVFDGRLKRDQFTNKIFTKKKHFGNLELSNFVNC